MDIQHLYDYCSSVSKPESKLLSTINRETHLRMINPRMLAGHLQGKFLEMLSLMLRPQRILEIGTFTAYSTICLSAGLRDDGEIHTIEQNIELEGIILSNIHKASLTSKVFLHKGDAIDIIPTLTGMFDLIYLDADHRRALAYFRMLKPLITSGGFLIVDNALWNGKVPYPNKHDDPESKAMAAFNHLVLYDNEVDNLLLPFRDGIMLIRKK